MKQLKILHLISSDGLYGAERVVLSLAQEMRELGHNSIIGNLSDTENITPLFSAAAGIDVETYMLPLYSKINLKRFRAIIEFAREQDVDIIHSHGYRANILVSLTKAYCPPIATVSTLHGWTATSIFSRLYWYEFLDRLCVGRLNCVIAVSAQIEQRMRWFRRPTSTFIIRNGIDTTGIVANESPVERRLRNRREEFNILSAGRLSHEKGFDLLIDAIAALRNVKPRIAVRIAGDGPLKAVLKRQVSQLGLDSQIQLIGYSEDLSNEMSEADIFVLPSRTEGVPLILLEAMSSGTPIVATSAGDIPIIMKAGRYGILTGPANTSSIADGIKKAMQEFLTCKEIANSAARHIRRNYSSKSMASQYVTAYQNAIAQMSAKAY